MLVDRRSGAAIRRPRDTVDRLYPHGDTHGLPR
jgi:hypothetical protein